MKKMCSFILPMAFLVWWAVADPYSALLFKGPEDVTTVFILTKQQNLPEDHQNFTGLSCKEMSNQTWTNLILIDKGLTVFPSCLPKTLEILDLSDNKLSLLNTSEIIQLSQLQDLTMKHNRIEVFHCPNEGSSSLEVLDVSYNQLQSVPKCSTLLNLKRLSLAGNPVLKLERYAFGYFPNLAFLNLSATLLGKAVDGDISESTFARKTRGDKQYMPMAAMKVLDLSETFLLNIQQEWTKDLLNLEEFHIAKMAHLDSLDSNALKYLPNLSLLNCQDSHALSLVRTEIFHDLPHLKYLDFQNCNLSTLHRWNISSSPLNISLYGNPLKCSCELSWLLSDLTTVVLLRPEETLCSRFSDGKLSSQSLLELYNECWSNGSSKAVQPENATNVNTHSYRSITVTNTPPTTEARSPWPVFTDSIGQPRKPTTVNTHSYSDITVTGLTYSPPTGEAGSALPLLPITDSTLHSSGSTVRIDQSTLLYNDITHVPTINKAESSVAFPNEPFTHSDIHNNALKTTQTAESQKNIPAARPSQRHPDEDVPISYVSDDYDNAVDQQEKSTAQSKAILCDYHPCKHLQKPCLELQSLLRCFCPGLSGENTIPDPPRFRDVSEITDTSAQIHWCAPNSVVHKYQLIYHPEGSQNRTVVDEIYITARQYTLYSLLPGTTYQVCVVASNKAGSSEPINESLQRSPCIKLKTKPSYIIILAVLCSVSGILLIGIIILSACLYKKSKSPQTNLYDTKLISYKNPAFEHQLKPQIINSLTE